MFGGVDVVDGFMSLLLLPFCSDEVLLLSDDIVEEEYGSSIVVID